MKTLWYISKQFHNIFMVIQLNELTRFTLKQTLQEIEVNLLGLDILDPKHSLSQDCFKPFFRVTKERVPNKKTTKLWTYVQTVGRQGILEPNFFPPKKLLSYQSLTRLISIVSKPIELCFVVKLGQIILDKKDNRVWFAVSFVS